MNKPQDHPRWDAQAEHHYNEAHAHLAMFQRRIGAIRDPLDFVVWATAFEAMAMMDLVKLRDEVNSLIKRLGIEPEEEEQEYGFVDQRPEPKEWR